MLQPLLSINHPSITAAIKGLENYIEEVTGEKIEVAVQLKITGLTLHQLSEIICGVVGITEEALKSKCRKRDNVVARQFFCYFGHVHCQRTLDALATYVGYTDHSDAVRARDKAKDLIEVNDYSTLNYLSLIKKAINKAIV